MSVDLERFHAGDEALFAELVTALSPRLVPYLRRYAESTADVHDLLQETWVHAYEKRRSFSGRGSLFGWLLAVCRTVGVATLRRRGREPETSPLGDVAAEDRTDASSLRDELRQAVMSLPERQRDVVLLRLVEGTSTADTARALGCAEGTVKATLHQAVRKLRESLKETIR